MEPRKKSWCDSPDAEWVFRVWVVAGFSSILLSHFGACGETTPPDNKQKQPVSGPPITFIAGEDGWSARMPKLWRTRDPETGWTCYLSGTSDHPGGIFCSDKIPAPAAVPAEQP